MDNTSSSTSAHFDISALDNMVKGDAQRFRKYALLFMQSMEDVLQQVAQACTQSDLSTLSAMGHRAKSTAMVVGAAKLAETCRALEMAGKAGDAETALALAQQLRPQFVDICTRLATRLAP